MMGNSRCPPSPPKKAAISNLLVVCTLRAKNPGFRKVSGVEQFCTVRHLTPTMEKCPAINGFPLFCTLGNLEVHINLVIRVCVLSNLE